MNNKGPARIKYYKGQMLTAQDFNDQQEYHREKQKIILRRFPYGIIGGLDVRTDIKKDEVPNDFDGLLITEGLAVDPAGNQIVVPEGGYKVSLSDFDPKKPYLSLIYDEVDDFKGDGFCTGNQKNNRVNERFDKKWDIAPNLGLQITVAKIEVKTDQPGKNTLDSYKVIAKEEEGGPRIRINAAVIGADQIADNAVITTKIQANAVTAKQIAKDAVTAEKIQAESVEAGKLGKGELLQEAVYG